MNKKMLNFYTRYFVRMNEIMYTFLIVLATFLIIVGSWRLYTGHYPGSKYIITDPPVTSSTGLDEDQAKFMFFQASWCPHCKSAEPIWASFKQQLKNNPSKYGNYDIIFEDIDIDKDKGKTALYSIKSYPTFKVETHKKVYEYVGKPDVKSFDSFLSSVLGQKVIQNSSTR